jgi:hypothetical protein
MLDIQINRYSFPFLKVINKIIVKDVAYYLTLIIVSNIKGSSA